MIRVPVDTDDGGDELFPAASFTYRVEWSDRDESGLPLPRGELFAHFVTPFGTASRRIRLRLADEPRV